MAITYEVRQDLLTAIVGMFDGAPTLDILTSLVERLEDGATVAELADELGNTAELASIYPTFLTAEEFAASFVGNLLGDNVDAATLALGEEFVAGLINGGSSRGEAMYTAIQALSSVSEDDATWGAAVTQLNNKVDVATTFALTTDFSGLTMEELRSVTADVDASEESVTDKKALIQAGILDAEEQTQRLTTGQDFLQGTSLKDFFKANYFDNQNTLQSGDEINGGAGEDTLFAKIGDSAEYAINVETTSVEVAKFQAQAQANDSSDNEVKTDAVAGDNNDYAQVDAQDMDGTVEFWSVNSRADLVIEDVRNDSDETTIVMQDTDSGDVDYAVYFDDQHITAPDGTTAGSSLYLEILDLQGMADGTGPLTNNPYKGVVITVDGVEVELVADEAINADNLGAEPTYQDIVDALNAALAEAGYTSITASLGETFSKYSSDDGELYSGTTIVLTNTGSEELGSVGWVADGAVPAETNVHTNITNEDPAVTTYLTQTDIELDNVGRGSESGDLRVGNMSTGDSGSAGIQQFNVTVHDSSWITSLSTTNDDLEEVYVVNSTELLDEGTNGDLRIGDNGDDDGYTGLANVRVFDASAMTGNVTLEADLDDSVIDKYFDLEDSQSDYTTDNIQFNYSTGSGDDVIELTVSEEAVSYEDFELTIDTGAGDDEVIFEVTGTAADDLDANWDVDQAALDNIVIATGAGNDTVRALGDGEVTITTGAGDDVVYSDNSGAKATWVVNAANTDIDDLQNTTATSAVFLVDGKLTVTLTDSILSSDADAASPYTAGYEVTVDVPTGDNYAVTEEEVNQAIKDAINNDSVLSKLLVATDGPDNTLVITSLIDGTMAAGNLEIVLSSSYDITTASNATAIQSAYKAFTGNSEATYANGVNTASLGTLNGLNGLGVNGAILGQDDVYTDLTVVTTTPGTTTAQEVFTVTIANTAGDETGTTYTLTIDDVEYSYTATADIDEVAIAAGLEAQSGGLFTVAGTDATTLTVTMAANGNVVASATSSILTDLTGSDSTVGSDNTINAGTGDDVIVLSTDGDDGVVGLSTVATAASNETIVYTGLFGNDTIVNFESTAGADGEDSIDFQAILDGQYYYGSSTSTTSQNDLNNTIAADSVLSANEVLILDDLDGLFTATDTWANLTAANLLSSIQNDSDVTNDFGNIADATANLNTLANINGEIEAATVANSTLVGTTVTNIIMVENDTNAGEYKVFEVTGTAGTTSDFTSATLLGTVDFGESLAGDTFSIVA